jgi:hypothetical protein
MVFLQLLLVVLVVLGFMALSAKAPSEERPKGPSAGLRWRDIHTMSRDDVRRVLIKIETGAEPSEKQGAMCYDISMPPAYEEYVCPLDGEKTVYSKGSPAQSYLGPLLETQNLLKVLQSSVKGISFVLDTARLCSTCFPGVDDTQRYILLRVNYPDGRSVESVRIVPDDIRYLIGFFTNGRTYRTDTGGERPLKRLMPRLKELLGEQ